MLFLLLAFSWFVSVRARATSTLTRLCFQLFLQLLEKSPVGSLRDYFLRARFDHARFVETEGKEAYRVLRVVLAPSVVGQFRDRLERRLGANRVPFVRAQ